MSSAHPVTSHDEIRQWADTHGGRPAMVDAEGEGGILRLDFQEKDEKLKEIFWEEFFKIFEERKLAEVGEPRARIGQILEERDLFDEGVRSMSRSGFHRRPVARAR